MANEYLSLDQVCEALGAKQSDVKSMVADGRLHEFRDAGKVFFKRAEVERMAAKEGSSIVDLAAGDEVVADHAPDENASFASALTSLADSSSSLGLGEVSPLGGEIPPDQPSELNLLDEPSSTSLTESGSSLGLSPLEMKADDFPKDLPAAPKDGKELTSEIDLLPMGEDEEIKPAPAAPVAKTPAADELELSGSSIIALEPGEDSGGPPPPKPAAAPAGAKGISVFEDEEVEIAADPMGETRISAGVDELEAVGSGSGLLDLTQVSDDTSLGAELLDVISPTAAGDTEAEEAEPVVEAAETVEDAGVVVAEAEPDTAPVMSRSAPAAAIAAPRPVV
ncbi:MAG TPA: helix-turn-helix domain-containing protein, partial [Phycisphaerae bacterium]|nr:helix-turn-helix domain-containing protein [Phycisphaerae bacterium]